MSIRIGLYDFFAYTLPGVCYILIAVYGLAIFGFINIDLSLLNSLSLFSVLALIGAGYIIGLLFDPIAYRWARLFQKSNRETARLAFDEFSSRHPWLKANFKAADWGLLLRAVKSRSIEAAMDVEQHNVASIMLRNISLGLLLLAVIYMLFFLIINFNLWNLVLATLCCSLSIIAIQRSKLRRHWFYIAIFEAFAAHFLLQKEWNRSLESKEESPGVDILDLMPDSGIVSEP
jgi:hypothetical protein